MPDIKIAELLVNVGSSSNGINWGDFFTSMTASLSGALFGAGAAFGLNCWNESKKYKQRLKDEEEKIKRENIIYLKYIHITVSDFLSSLLSIKLQYIADNDTNTEFEIINEAIMKGREEIEKGNNFHVEFNTIFKKLINKRLIPVFSFPIDIDRLSFIANINENIILLFYDLCNQLQIINKLIDEFNTHTNILKGRNDFSDFELLWSYHREFKKSIDYTISLIILLIKCLDKVLGIIDKSPDKLEVVIPEEYKYLIPIEKNVIRKNIEEWISQE